MPQYRRAYIENSVVFITCVTYRRRSLFVDEETIALLRRAIAQTRKERPFEIVGAAVLPDHLHFLWQLPEGDCNYSARVGRMKVLFTRAFRAIVPTTETVSASRQKHRERDVWQRRFWERSLCDRDEVNHYLDYIHYNPVKHGLVACPHQWKYSSFGRYVERGMYSENWGCCCDRREPTPPDFRNIEHLTGE